MVCSEDGLRVRSRRGWNITAAAPELRGLPKGLLLDGELVAFNRYGVMGRPRGRCRTVEEQSATSSAFGGVG
jgi:hypothetical protein